MEYIETEEIKKYLSTFNQSSTLEEILYNDISKKSQLKDIDFLAMAMVEMTKKSHIISLGPEDN